MHTTGPVALPVRATRCRSGRRGLWRATLQRLEVGDQAGPIRWRCHCGNHGRSRHEAGRRFKKSVQRGRLPEEPGRFEGIGVTEAGNARRLAAEHTLQVRALRAAAIPRLGGMTQRALLAEALLACSRVRGHRSGADRHEEDRGSGLDAH